MKKKDDKMHKIPEAHSGEKQAPTPEEIEAAGSLGDVIDGKEAHEVDEAPKAAQTAEQKVPGEDTLSLKAAAELSNDSPTIRSEDVPYAIDGKLEEPDAEHKRKISGEMTSAARPVAPPEVVIGSERPGYQIAAVEKEIAEGRRKAEEILEEIMDAAAAGPEVFKKFEQLGDATDVITFFRGYEKATGKPIDIQDLENIKTESSDTNDFVAGTILFIKHTRRVNDTLEAQKKPAAPAQYAKRESGIGMKVLTYGVAVALAGGGGFFAGQLMYKSDATQKVELEARLASTNSEFDKYRTETVSATAKMRENLNAAEEQHNKYKEDVEAGKKAEQEQVERLKEKITAEQGRYEQERAGLQGQLTAEKSKNETATEEIKTMIDMWTEADASLTQTRMERDAAKAEVEKVRAELTAHVRAQEARAATATAETAGPQPATATAEVYKTAEKADDEFARKAESTPPTTTANVPEPPKLNLDYLLSKNRSTFDAEREAKIREAQNYTAEIFGANVDARIQYKTFIDTAQSHLENGTWGTPEAQKELRQAYKGLQEVVAPSLMDNVDAQLEGMRRTLIRDSPQEPQKDQSRKHKTH